jgi:hypothetical protein
MIVTDVGHGMRWTRQRRRVDVIAGRALLVSDQEREDERCCSGRQNRVVLAPVAGVKSAEVFRARPGFRCALIC